MEGKQSVHIRNVKKNALVDCLEDKEFDHIN